MAIFNSYVSLPEGNHQMCWKMVSSNFSANPNPNLKKHVALQNGDP